MLSSSAAGSLSEEWYSFCLGLNQIGIKPLSFFRKQHEKDVRVLVRDPHTLNPKLSALNPKPLKPRKPYTKASNRLLVLAGHLWLIIGFWGFRRFRVRGLGFRV